jgi:hypothetical protein
VRMAVRASLPAGPLVRLTRVGRSPSCPVVLMAAAVVCAHLPYLLGLFDPNPTKAFSGLTSGIQPGLLPGYDTIDPNTGFTSQAFSHLAATDWLHGVVPWWNPTEGIGSPLAGDMKGMALFLPFVLLLHFAEGQIALYLIFDLIAALAMYFLLRRVGLSAWVSAAAGVVFGLNGTMAWNRYAAADPVCFLPLAILGLELIRDGIQSQRRTRWWVAAVAVAMSIYAGFPETAYLDGVVIAVWGLARLPGLDRHQVRRYLAVAVAAGLVGALIAAPVLTAFVDYLPHAFVGGHGGGFAHGTVPRAGVAALMFPYLFGPIFGFTSTSSGGIALNRFWDNVGGYLTAATIVLALIGVQGRPYRLLRLCLAGTAVLFLGRIFGISPFVTFFNAVPGMSHVAAYRYSYPALEFCFIVLAAFGIESLIRKELNWPRISVTFAVTLGLAVLTFQRGRSLAEAISGVPGARVWLVASLLWGIGTVVLLLGAAVIPMAFVGRVVLVTLLPLESVAMFMTPELSTFRGGTLDVAAVAFLRQHTGLDRVYTLGPLEPNYGSYFGINLLNIDDVPVPQTFKQLIETQLDPNVNPLVFSGTTSIDPRRITPSEALARYLPNYERLGLKYVLVPSGAPDPLKRPPLRLVYHDAVVDIYATPHTRPFYSDPGGTCAFSAMTYSHVLVDCSTPAIVTRNELEMPGQSASVDGRAVAVRADSDGLGTIAVPAGVSTLKFGFEPPHTPIALVAALLGLALCAGAGPGLRTLTSHAGRRRSSRSTPTGPRPIVGGQDAGTRA